jgi:alpha-galactosidase
MLETGTAPGDPILIASAGPLAADGTALILIPQTDGLPAAWACPLPAGGVLDPADAAALLRAVRPCSLLPEQAAGWFGRPGLSGHRPGGGGQPAGRDWSPWFAAAGVDRDGGRVRVEAEDKTAGLHLVTEAEAVPGGAIRARHTLVNTAAEPYLVEHLDVVFPLPARVGEVLDFTGRWAAERTPQRHAITDGLWLREGRRGHTGHDAATVLIAGTSGFGFGQGEVGGVHVAWSGNTVHRVERIPGGAVTIGGGELLLPGEIALGAGESYTTPWVYLAASRAGLDGLAAQFHGYLRSLPAHPGTPRPVNLNVWEAVYFAHDLEKLTALADLAARIGVERFVLDDGWFTGRRDDRAGLGDWAVDETVWPGGLHRLTEHVLARGMRFGLWFEPEMVNPDSDLYRAHPDWILAAGHRIPPLQRNQLVLDLTRPEVADYLFDRISAVLDEYPVSYVKWDCNRDIVDGGSGPRDGAPAVHGQAAAVYALFDRLRARHPRVEWESCASGGGRIDLGILKRVERVWTSDLTDALARQSIQRWTGQLVPLEYLGAHVSAPFSHQTGRYLPLELRCATALFGHFGIEWDLTQAGEEDLAVLAAWIGLYKRHRGLLHSGRVVRLDVPAEAGAWMHGVVAADGEQALMCRVQLDLPGTDQPFGMRIPGLDPARRYRVTDVTPGDGGQPLPAVEASGAALAEMGLAIEARRPLRATVFHVTAR